MSYGKNTRINHRTSRSTPSVGPTSIPSEPKWYGGLFFSDNERTGQYFQTRSALPVLGYPQCDTETQSDSCVSLLLHNFADLMWQRISCTAHLFRIAPCMIAKNNHTISINVAAQPEQQHCRETEILKNKSCFDFVWKSKLYIKQCSSSLSMFEYLLDALAATLFPPVVISWNKLVQLKRHFHVHDHKDMPLGIPQEGFCIKTSSPEKSNASENVFLCEENIQISAQFVCDNVADCQRKVPSDEVNCVWNGTSITQFALLSQVSQGHKICSPLFFTSHNNSCLVYVFKEQTRRRTELDQHTTYQRDKHLVKRNVSCKIRKFKMNSLEMQCDKKFQIQCAADNPTCFNVSKICSFVLDVCGGLQPCEKGEHLQHCKDFECNLMFKCPFYYCVPWTYVCDGKLDCPSGSDESSEYECGIHRRCRTLFKCRKYPICIHTSFVCNKVSDCPLADDEDICSLYGTVCPQTCQCLTFAAYCSKTHMTLELAASMSTFRVLFFENITISPNMILVTMGT